MTQHLELYADASTPAGRVAGLAEDIEALELAIHQALARVDDVPICDGKTIMLLQWAALRGPFASSLGARSRSGSHLPSGWRAAWLSARGDLWPSFRS